MWLAMTVPRRSLLFGLAVALVACGRSGLGDADGPSALDARALPDDAAYAPPFAEDSGRPADDASVPTVPPPSTEDADSPRVCPVDAGGTLLDAGGCSTRAAIACAPPPGETVQATLDEQLLGTPCRHGEGAGGFTVRFDSEGCALEISGGAFSACDVAALSSVRFLCALGHPCAVAPSLVK